MITQEDQVNQQETVRRYRIQYPVSAYTFPAEARIGQVRFDDEYIHIKLEDGRMLSVPLWWIPTIYNAPPQEREKYEINRNRTVIIWDPDKCAINEDLCITDYLCSTTENAQRRDQNSSFDS